MHNNPAKAILLMIISVVGISTMAMLSKYLSPTHSAIDAVFYRNFFGLIIVSIIIMAMGRPDYFKTKRLKTQIIRCLFGTFGVCSMFYAYSLMPMAETTTVMFAGGIATPIMAMIFLKEKIGVYRWSAIVIGIVGAIVVVMPEEANVNVEGVIVALVSSIIGGGVVSILLRSLGQTDHPLTTVFYFFGIGLILLFPFMVLWGKLPTQGTFVFAVMLGVLGVVNQFFKGAALKWGEASMLAPLMYTNLIWATIYGWFIWNEWPTWNVFVGGVIIIGSNCVIIWREKVKKDIKG